MGTSVGSKALTLRKAVILAAILEFSGAFFIGSNVSETIQKGIVDPTIFTADPMIFVLGMMGSLLATGALLQLASYKGLPISTTHAIVGAVIGFGVVIGGIEAIFWPEVGKIVLSWVLSPVLSGAVSFFLFRFIQRKILHAPSPIQAMQKLVPYLAFFIFTTVSLILLHQSSSQFNLPLTATLCASTAVGLVGYFFSAKLIQPKLVAINAINLSQSTSETNVEKIFISLQIVSACLVAFAHGANDVANAIGPVAAVLNVLKTQSLSAKTYIPTWLLVLGGGGIVIGLATWGWRVIETIGKKITELTPTRGFSAEFGAAITILLASKIGLPISTTHALVGAVLGVGLTRGIEALNLKMIKEIVVSWAVTIPLCALFSVISFYLLKWIVL